MLAFWSHLAKLRALKKKKTEERKKKRVNRHMNLLAHYWGQIPSILNWTPKFHCIGKVERIPPQKCWPAAYPYSTSWRVLLQNRPAAQQKELFWLPKRGESWCSVIPPPVPIGEDSVGLSAPNALSENPFPIFPGWVKCRTELFSKCMSFPEISAALLKALRLMWFYQQHQWPSRLTQRLPGCMVELCSAAYCTLWHQTILLSQFTFPLQLKCRKCRLGRLSHNKQEWDLDADTAFGKKNLTEFTTFKPEP